MKKATMYLSFAALGFVVFKIITSKRVCVSAGPFKVCNDD